MAMSERLSKMMRTKQIAQRPEVVAVRDMRLVVRGRSSRKKARDRLATMLPGHERSRNPFRIIKKIDNSVLVTLLSDTSLSRPLEVMIGVLLQPYAVPGSCDKVGGICKLPWQVHIVLKVGIHVVTWGCGGRRMEKVERRVIGSGKRVWRTDADR